MLKKKIIKGTHAQTLELIKKVNSKSKRSQEEMVGFAVIIIIIAVVLLIFLSLSLRNNKSENVEDYATASFIQSFLQYTTDCAEGYEPRYQTLEKLIIACDRKEKCLDERDTCEVLESTLRPIMRESWNVGADTPVKGYELKIASKEQEILGLKEGNMTNNYKSSVQELGRENIQIILNVYF